MTTVYPGALDALTNPTASDQTTSPSHAAQHANANDAIEAVQAELGINPRPGAIRARRGADQSIANADDTTVIYDTITNEDDEHGNFTHNTTTGILTINTAGWYAITAGVLWASHATGLRRIEIWHGLTAIAIDTRGAVSGTIVGQTVTTLFKFAAADTTRAVVHQTSGGALNYLGAPPTFFAVHRVR